MLKRYSFAIAAILPMVAALLVSFYFISAESARLSQQSLVTLESFLLRSKEQELNNYTNIALSSIDHVYSSADIDNHIAQAMVADVFDRLSYQNGDGYFFVYSHDGINIVHPKHRFRVGKSWWDLQDNEGTYLIRDLVEKAQQGGGYVDYRWEKPSSQEIGDKLSYARSLDKWGWMVGTGVYLDDVQAQLNQLQTQMDNHIKATTKIILLVAISAILIVVVLNILAALRQKKQSDQKVDELSQRIIDLQEQERRRISHELHDGIVQLLVSIRYYFDYLSVTLKKQAVAIPDQLYTAQSTLDQAIAEIRRISREMHPRILDELGLSEAIEALANEFSKRTGIDVELHKPSLRKVLPADISTSLYRVAQESLTNIEKHSNATKVCIKIEAIKRSIILSIEDNGKSTNSQDLTKSGIGLRNLAERIDYYNGEFTADFGEDGGRVKARIPLKQS